jgi:glycosyltransferase involved in cell wall biosynthesis
VFCLPSTVEGLGLAVVEAMAAGVPFVVSELPALVETTGRKGGFFFEPTKYKDLADKLLRVLKDKKIQRDLIKEGTGQAKKYDWEILVKKIEKVYNDVMATKKG